MVLFGRGAKRSTVGGDQTEAVFLVADRASEWTRTINNSATLMIKEIVNELEQSAISLHKKLTASSERQLSNIASLLRKRKCSRQVRENSCLVRELAGKLEYSTMARSTRWSTAKSVYSVVVYEPESLRTSRIERDVNKECW